MKRERRRRRLWLFLDLHLSLVENDPGKTVCASRNNMDSVETDDSIFLKFGDKSDKSKKKKKKCTHEIKMNYYGVYIINPVL